MASSYLVTGAAGFIGARFVESCRRWGVKVISVDEPKHFKERGEHKGLNFGTIVDREKLFEWLETEQPSIKAVIHLGACSNTQQTDAKYLDKWNVEYSKKLWDYCTTNEIPFIYASSAATYGGGEYGYADDELAMHKLKPLNLYGQSKLTFDLWALEAEKRGHQPPAWSGFKFFNVYGFGERHKGSQASVVLHGFDQVSKNGSIRLFRSHREEYADGEQKRDFIWVDDVTRVLHFAIEKPIRRGIYNLGTGEARTFLDLATAVFSCFDVPERIGFIDTPPALREKYQYFTEADMKKLRTQGYTAPFTPLEEGVKSYIEQLKSKL